MHRYAPAPREVLAKVAAIEAVCARHAVELPAAALHFVLAHPAVASVIPGATSEEQVRDIARWATADVPGALWQELEREGLIEEGCVSH